MATQSKAQFLNDVHTLLKKRYKPKAERTPTRLTVLEAVVYGICHEDSTREQANQALSRFKDDFFDWNEVRVSSLDEIQTALAGLPEADGRAYRIRRFLRQLFERTYGFTLDALAKKPLKESIKVLHDYEALGSDYVTATVVQQALGGHAIPVDASSRRALERLGIVEPGTDPAAIRSLLERAVPKNRGTEFGDLIEELAHDTCIDPAPICPSCELRKICPYPRTHKDAPAPAKKEKEAAAPVKAAPKSAAGAKEKDAKPAAAKPTIKAEKPSAKPAPKSPPARAAKDTPVAPPKASKGKPGGGK
jgi:endonuclease-3